jgi:hypothetical protein
LFEPARGQDERTSCANDLLRDVSSRAA